MRTVPPLCPVPEAYAWSSYPILLGRASRPEWLTVDWVLARFGAEYAGARARLREFVEEGPEERPLPVGGLYFGEDSFIRERTAAIEPISEVPRAHWQPLRPPLSKIFASAVNPVAAAYRTYGYTLGEIAEHLGCHYSTVSRRLRRSELRECKT